MTKTAPAAFLTTTQAPSEKASLQGWRKRKTRRKTAKKKAALKSNKRTSKRKKAKDAKRRDS